jgi:serine protease Do
MLPTVQNFARFLAFGCVLAAALPLAAQDELGDEESPLDQARRGLADAVRRIAIPRSRFADSRQVRGAFRDAVAEASQATVSVRSDGKDVALGGVVGPDGWILTKSSSLSKSITVRLRDGREFDAELVGTDDEHDLAMLKVDARRLVALDLSNAELPEVGRLIASVAPARDPLAVGIVSVGPRTIAKQPGILGVRLEAAEDERPLVVLVSPDSGAERAGILVNDIIVAVNDKPTENREVLIQTVREYSPDDEIEVTVERNGEQMKIRATLTDTVRDMPFDRGAYQNNLGGSLSRRRYGFPTVFQHDTVLQPDHCGGPLVDLDGRVVGFNIARAGRTESYAVPVAAILPRLFDLMSGTLAPADGDAQQQTVDKDRAEADDAVKAAAEQGADQD